MYRDRYIFPIQTLSQNFDLASLWKFFAVFHTKNNYNGSIWVDKCYKMSHFHGEKCHIWGVRNCNQMLVKMLVKLSHVNVKMSHLIITKCDKMLLIYDRMSQFHCQLCDILSHYLWIVVTLNVIISTIKMLSNVNTNVTFTNINVTLMNEECSTMDIFVTIQKSSQIFFLDSV